jgi:tetratricopeptide (TPR) repeat protein
MSNGKAEKRSRATTTCEFVAKCADTPAGWCLLVTRRKYDQVITQLKEALKNDTENAELLSHLGMVYYKVGFYDNAIKTLQEASDAPTQQLTFNPRHNLAYVLHYTGQYRQAWENWHEAVKNYKILDDAREAYYCGIIFDQIFRDSAEAERWYKRAIEKQPGWDRAWLQLALLYNNMATEGGDSAFDALSGRAKAFREAREALEAKLRKHDDADVHHRLAVLYLGTGELTKAEDQLTKAGEALDKRH